MQEYYNRISERLWRRMKERGLTDIDCPHKDAVLRVGDKSTIACTARYNQATQNGTMLPSKDQQPTERS